MNIGFENSQFGANIFGIGRRSNNVDYWETFTINLANGKVAIGDVSTFPNGYKLYVEDGIITERVKVAINNSSDWADYVFADDYHLQTLPEVEQFVRTNKHLPGVPSAEEVAANGIDVATMDAKLLEKIEELYLHVIELDKQLKAVQDENAELRNRLDARN